MSDVQDQLQGPAAGVDPPQVSVGELSSIARRRTLLKGVGKAGAVAGAAIPLRSLAGGDRPKMRLFKDGKFYHCNVSGNGSILQSAAAAAVTTTCKGGTLASYKADAYGNRPGWPSGPKNPVCPVGAINYLPSAKFSVVFGVSSPTTSIGTLVDSGSSDYAHWVIAMLNATKMSPSFPYTTSEVKALYKDTQRRAAALAFFKTYLEG